MADDFLQRAEQHLWDLLQVEGLSGQEGDVAARVREKLLAAGCKQAWFCEDRTPCRVYGFACGNLIVRIPGVRGRRRSLFSAHLDTVPLCRGARPKRVGGRLVPAGATGLGADDRSGVACLVALAEELIRGGYRYPSLTLLFTVGEEVGLKGAGALDVKKLGAPAWGVNIDSGIPAELVTGAIGQDQIQIEVIGKSSHAAVHPEDGISAITIASRAIAELDERGLLGAVQTSRGRGTANVGVLRGGEATNQVTDRVTVQAEARSHGPVFRRWLTKAIRNAFERAAANTRNVHGEHGRIEFRAAPAYEAFRFPASHPLIRHAERVARATGLRPTRRVIDGGLDANKLNAHGIPTITIGAGQHNIHTTDEYLDLGEFREGCRYALALAVSDHRASA